ncbi:hypothetical protein RA307_31705 [Xanthobacteraceae bacterium Astr-EGSB]|nr:hypothetical protein [Xanthobacteraceae bacterium Astr-EGSB]
MSWFALADRLHMTVAELKSKLSHVEFIDWLAYLRILDRESR